MQIMARSLAPEGAAVRPSPPGVPYQIPRLLAADTLRGGADVIGPDGTKIRSTITAFPDGLRVDIPDPQRAGVYRVRSAEEVLAAAAINLDPRESDLRRLPAERLAERLRGQGIVTETSAASGADKILDLEGHPLWGSLLLAAACAIGIELFLLGLWRR